MRNGTRNIETGNIAKNEKGIRLLAAAIIHRAWKDMIKPDMRGECQEFFDSPWFNVLCEISNMGMEDILEGVGRRV